MQMQFDAPFRFMNTIDASLNANCLIEMLNSTPHQSIFIKDALSNYHYANGTFLDLMGLKNVSQLKGLNDFDLSKNKQDADKYRDLDCFVLEENRALAVREQISPLYNETIIQTMKGKLYPLIGENGRTKYVMGMVSPESKLLKLDWDTVFKLTVNEFDSLLLKSSYTIKLYFGSLDLSKTEIKILVQLLRGSSADEIANVLQIKQTIVTSYLNNIKNKLGVNNNSELLNLVIGEKILHKIML